MDQSESRALLTMADVQAWREKRSRLESQIHELLAQLAETNKKLDAAALFLPEAVKESDASEQEKAATLPDLILAILDKAPQGLTKQEILGQIREQKAWQKRLEATTNYFYTVMIRLQKRGQVVPDGKKYRLPDSEGAPSRIMPEAGAPSSETRTSHPGVPLRGSVNPEREVEHDHMN